MRKGTFLEEFIAQEFAKAVNCNLYNDSYLYIDKEFEFLAGHLDRLINFDEQKENVYVLECKHTTTNLDEPKYNHVLQLQWYLMLTNLKAGYLAYDTSYDLKYFKIERDEELIKYIRDYAVFFWNNYILKNIPPKPENLDDVKKIYNIAKEYTTIEASENILNIVANIKINKEAIKKIEAENAQLETQLLEYIKDNETLIYNDIILATYKNQVTKKFDVNAFKEQHNDYITNF
jgi:Phage-related protein, predicted endonuclease